MANIIDALVVTLSLDSSKYKQGADEAIKQQEKMADAVAVSVAEQVKNTKKLTDEEENRRLSLGITEKEYKRLEETAKNALKHQEDATKEVGKELNKTKDIAEATAKSQEKSSKKIGEEIKKTKDETVTTSKEMQAKGQVAGEFFSKIRNEAIALFAVITAGRGLKDLFSDVTTGDASTGRTAKNLNITTEELGQFKNAGELAGGTAEGMAASLQALSDAGTEMIRTGKTAMLPYLQNLHMSFFNVNGSLKTSTQLIRELHDNKFLQNMPRQQANAWLAQFIPDQGTRNLILEADKQFQQDMADALKAGVPTEADALGDQKLLRELVFLRKSFLNFAREIERSVTPALTKFFDWLTARIQENGAHFAEEFTAKAEQFVAFLEGVDWTAVGARIDGLVTAMVSLTQSVGGVANAVEILFALWVGSKFLAVMANIAMLTRALVPLAAAGGGGGGLGTLLAPLVPLLLPLALSGDTGGEGRVSPEQEAKNRAAAIAGGAKTPMQALSDWWHGGAQAAPGAPGGGAAPGAAPTAGGGGDKAQQAMTYFMGQGWTQAQAAGLVANIQRESNFNPSALGDSGQARGLGQWHPDRQADFARFIGHDIQHGTFAEQLAFMNYELTQGKEKRAGDMLRAALTSRQSGAAVSMYSERPADRMGEAFIRGNMAGSIESRYGARQVAMNSNIHHHANSNNSEVHIQNMNVNAPNAKDSQGIAMAMRDSMMRHSLVSQSNTGLA